MEPLQVTWDQTANAASIKFGNNLEKLRSTAVTDEDGDVIAILDFSSSGELFQIELLDANTQLPQSLRKE